MVVSLDVLLPFWCPALWRNKYCCIEVERDRGAENVVGGKIKAPRGFALSGGRLLQLVHVLSKKNPS